MAKLDTENGRFEQWLSRQTARNDFLGELARHTHDLGFDLDLFERCRRHSHNADLETHLDQSPPVLGMRQAWEGWSAANREVVQRHWPAALAKLNQLPVTDRPKITWLPDEDNYPFPNGRKITVEACGETVILRFKSHEDRSMWKRDDNTASVAAALSEVIGRPFTIRDEL